MNSGRQWGVQQGYERGKREKRQSAKRRSEKEKKRKKRREENLCLTPAAIEEEQQPENCSSWNSDCWKLRYGCRVYCGASAIPCATISIAVLNFELIFRVCWGADMLHTERECGRVCASIPPVPCLVVIQPSWWVCSMIEFEPQIIQRSTTIYNAWDPRFYGVFVRCATILYIMDTV